MYTSSSDCLRTTLLEKLALRVACEDGKGEFLPSLVMQRFVEVTLVDLQKTELSHLCEALLLQQSIPMLSKPP